MTIVRGAVGESAARNGTLVDYPYPERRSAAQQLNCEYCTAKAASNDGYVYNASLRFGVSDSGEFVEFCT